jgi:Putative member of DMT superfamily (DUF486)
VRRQAASPGSPMAPSSAMMGTPKGLNRWLELAASCPAFLDVANQLKTIQEVITLCVFGVFSVVYLQQVITWNQVIGYALIAGGAFFVFRAPL